MENIYLGKGSRKAVMVPEILYKKSNLKRDMNSITDDIRLVPLAFPNAIGMTVNAEASCERDTFHMKAPSKGCQCGFHAYKELPDAQAHNQGGDFILRVVASGKMFEYNKGYRYGHQRVEEVIISSCFDARCSEFADRLLIYSTGLIRPICYQHSGVLGDQKIISFSELEKTVSSSLPANSPKITIRSISPKLVPWEKGISVRNTVSYVKSINTQNGGFPFGTAALVVFSAAMAIISARQDAARR